MILSSNYQLTHSLSDFCWPTKEQIFSLEPTEFAVFLVRDAIEEYRLRNRFISAKKLYGRSFSTHAGPKALTDYQNENRYSKHLFPRYLLVTRIS